MTNSNSVRDRVIEHLLRASDCDLQPTEVTPESTLRADLGLGSLQAISLMLDLEDDLDITVADAEVERLHTVGDLIELIELKLAAKGPGA